MLLEGLHLPVTTPFYPDGRLNLHKLEYNVSRYSKSSAAGMVVLGEAGEPSLLSDDETKQALRSAIAAASLEKVMLAGVSRDSVAGTLELADAAAEMGYDAVLVKVPGMLERRVHESSAKEMLFYFQAVADRSALPVVIVSGSAKDGRVIPSELVVELAQTPGIIGIVDGDAGAEWIRKTVGGTAGVRHEVAVTTIFRAVTARMRAEGESAAPGELIAPGTLTGGGAALTVLPKPGIKTRSKMVGFQILAGSTAGMLEGLLAGAVGAVPAFAASAPQACYEVVAAWKDGDEALAREKQERLRGLAERVEEELGVAGVKYGCDLNGYFGGVPRLPLLPLTGQERAEIEKLMQGIRN